MGVSCGFLAMRAEFSSQNGTISAEPATSIADYLAYEDFKELRFGLLGDAQNQGEAVI